MPLIRLPGLIDPHVHVREPGQEYKEDWDTATQAALAGGFTAILAMPNTRPPVTDEATLHEALRRAAAKARCDYAQYLTATREWAFPHPELAWQAAGLKLYLSRTFGPIWLNSTAFWHKPFRFWPRNAPLVVHAERVILAAALFFAWLYDRPIHVAHVAYREEILLIRGAKERGWPVTCEVTPHHLFLTQEDVPRIGKGWAEVRPMLGTAEDRAALWANLNVIDVFATDHAPHTRDEKRGPNPPPGYPGLETALPLLFTAVQEGRLTLDDLVARMHTHVRRIFHLPLQPETWVEIDPDAVWEIPPHGWYTKADWTPFAGFRVRGRVHRVVLRGQTAYEAGKVLVPRGFGRNLRIPQAEPAISAAHN